jgi:NADH-quinone oxidoreductase subunit F
VNRPGIYELSAAVSLREVIYTHAGGLKDGKALKAVIPGGSSTPVLRPDEIDVTFDIESMMKIGTMAGTAGIIVIPEGSCMVRALLVLMNFYAHESCGQCTPCREGTGWLARIMRRIEEGNGRHGDIELILDVCDNMMGRTICALADAAVMPAQSFIWKFREEFDRHIHEKKCPFGNRF